MKLQNITSGNPSRNIERWNFLIEFSVGLSVNPSREVWIQNWSFPNTTDLWWFFSCPSKTNCWSGRPSTGFPWSFLAARYPPAERAGGAKYLKTFSRQRDLWGNLGQICNLEGSKSLNYSHIEIQEGTKDNQQNLEIWASTMKTRGC